MVARSGLRQGAKKTLKVVVVLVFGILVQTTFGNDLRVGGMAPDLMLLLAVCGGLVGGADEGAMIGFGAGLLNDLFLQGTPVGLSVLAFCLAGSSTGWARANWLRSRALLAPFLAAAGTLGGVALFVVIGYVVGQQQLVAPGQRWLVELAAVESAYAAIFCLPAMVLMAWALRGASAPSATAAAVPAVRGGRGRPQGLRNRRRRRVRARAR